MMLKRFLDCVFAIGHPAFWLSNYRSSAKYDELINTLIDEGATVIPRGLYHVELGGVVLWASNYPYAYGYNTASGDVCLPYRRTRKRLCEYIATNVNAAVLKKARGEA